MLHCKTENEMISPADERPENPDASLDSVRTLLLNRLRELRVSLADASRQIGRNESYIHQFIYRRSPKRLPEDVRASLARLLRLPEDTLRDPLAIPLAESLLPAHVPPPEATVPVFSQGEVIDPARAKTFVPLPSIIVSTDQLFALWVSEDTGGMLREGDLVFARMTQPPRPGDLVAVMLDNRIKATGAFIGRDKSGRIRLSGADRDRTFAAEAKPLKIVLASFA